MTVIKTQKVQLKLQKAQIEFSQGNYLKSTVLCKKILDKDKNNIIILKLLTTNLIKLNRFSEAELILLQVLKLTPDGQQNDLLHLHGCNYISQFKYEKALFVLEKLFNKTGESKVLLDIALAYHKLCNYEASRDVYLKLIELEPNNHQAKFNLYPILLHFQDYKNAWACFHSRLERQEIKDQVHWFAPPWSGESLVDKNILIYPEQGIGDNLAYTGCFSEAIRDAAEVHIVCDKRLKMLYQFNFPSAKIYSYDDVNRNQFVADNIDIQILAGSLSYLYRDDVESFKRQSDLIIDPKLVIETRKNLSDKKLRIGISWFHGRFNDGNEHSMYLEELLPILKIEGIEWVNLQFGEWEKEVNMFKCKHKIDITHIENCDAAGDFEQYGALISNLDLVVSASNAALMFTSRLGPRSICFMPGVDKRVDKEVTDWLWHRNSLLVYKGSSESWENTIHEVQNHILTILNNVTQ